MLPNVFATIDPISIIFFAILGSSIGSFLNVLADHPSLKTLWRRSRCEGCKRDLRAFELVPVISFCALRGACARCGSRIPLRYPMVEAFVGLLFVLCAIHASESAGGLWSFVLLSDVVAVSVLTVTFLTDALRQEVNPSLLLGGTIAVAVLGVLSGASILHLTVGMVLGGGFFAAQHAVSRGRWVGLGDAWVGLFVGALVGFPMIGVVLIGSYICGAIVALGLLARGSHTKESRLAFGPFLAAVGLAVLFFGDAIVSAYWQFGDWLFGVWYG